jgi:hypothetical protein
MGDRAVQRLCTTIGAGPHRVAAGARHGAVGAVEGETCIALVVETASGDERPDVVTRLAATASPELIAVRSFVARFAARAGGAQGQGPRRPTNL